MLSRVLRDSIFRQALSSSSSGVSAALPDLKNLRWEGREWSKRGLRVGMQAAMMPTFTSRLRNSQLRLAVTNRNW